VLNPYWVSGLDAMFILKGSLNHVNVMKSEKTGVKWADVPKLSIHSGFLNWELDPLHIVQQIPIQELAYLANITESDLERVLVHSEAHTVVGFSLVQCSVESDKMYPSPLLIRS
jgi:hypothetical protein